MKIKIAASFDVFFLDLKFIQAMRHKRCSKGSENIRFNKLLSHLVKYREAKSGKTEMVSDMSWHELSMDNFSYCGL